MMLMIIGVVIAIIGLVILFIDEIDEGLPIAIIGFIILFIGIVIMCIKDPVYYETYKKKATQEEIIILETLNNVKYNSCSVRGGEVRKAIANRSSKKPEGSKSFSDIKSVVLFYDNSLSCGNKVTTIQQLYKEVYGKDLFVEDNNTSEDITSGEDTEITPSIDQIKDQVVESTVTLKEETLLSPAKIRELIDSAKTCNRAKVELLSLTKDVHYLTIDDYEDVTKLILDCENLNLQIELNK